MFNVRDPAQALQTLPGRFWNRSGSVCRALLESNHAESPGNRLVYGGTVDPTSQPATSLRTETPLAPGPMAPNGLKSIAVLVRKTGVAVFHRTDIRTSPTAERFVQSETNGWVTAILGLIVQCQRSLARRLRNLGWFIRRLNSGSTVWRLRNRQLRPLGQV